MNVESCMPGYLSNKPPRCYDLNVHITTKFTYLDFVKHQMTFDGHPLMVFQSCSFYSSIFCAELANNVSTHKSFSLKNILTLWIWFHELLIFLYFCKEGISVLYLIKESIKLLYYFQMWQKISCKDWSLLLVLCKSIVNDLSYMYYMYQLYWWIQFEWKTRIHIGLICLL